MTSPVLSELERIKRNEQIAAFDKNERAMLEKLGPPPGVDLADHQTFLALFLEWCTKQGVRSCLARPWVISTFLTEHAHRGEEFALNAINAIAALHDYHGQPNPAATRVVRAALDKIIKPEVPRSWTKAEKEMFSSLPPDIRSAINRRERQREWYVGQTRNELDQLRKKYEAKKTKTDKQTDTLKSRIEQLRIDCDAFLDKKAEEMRQPGVPVSSIRQILTVRYPGDPCRAALAILEKDEN